MAFANGYPVLRGNVQKLTAITAGYRLFLVAPGGVIHRREIREERPTRMRLKRHDVSRNARLLSKALCRFPARR